MFYITFLEAQEMFACINYKVLVFPNEFLTLHVIYWQVTLVVGELLQSFAC